LTLTAIASSDLNSDGNLDVIVADETENQALVFPGKPNGTFRNPLRFGAGRGTYGIAAGDLNGDGKPDIVTTNKVDNTISVLLNNGDGTFQTHVDYPATVFPIFALLADVNGDGKLDVIAAERENVSVWLNDGSGHFPSRIDTSISGADWLVTGDFDRDGKIDVAAVISKGSSGEISILLGDGQGHFTVGQELSVKFPGASVAIGDLNADGTLDIVALGHFPDQMYVFLGNGDGTFLDPSLTPVADYSGYVVLADFNRDGKLDLLTTEMNGAGGAFACLMYGNGDGTFQGQQTYWLDTQFTTAILPGDFNRDGALDAAFLATNGISVYLNTGAK
jgi:hypothetical protein